MSQRLWVVTPVYLDTASFLILRQRLHEELARVPTFSAIPAQFVVADDTGGVDPNIAALYEYHDVMIVEPPFNLGHQRAIVYALRTVSSRMDDDDLVVTMDADGEDAPSDVPRLLEELLAARSDRVVVLAMRARRSESPGFRIAYILFRAMFRVLTGTTVRSGNFAAYRGWIARRVLAHPHFDLCYSSTLTSLDLPIRPVECSRARRYAGKSRMNLAKLVRHGVSMLMPFLDRIAIRALLLFAIVVTASVALGVAVVGIKLFTGAAIPGWATSTLLALVIGCLVAIGNFVVLFAVYSQSRGLSLSDIEHEDRGSTRSPSSTADTTLP